MFPRVTMIEGMGSAISPYPGSFLELIVVFPATTRRRTCPSFAGAALGTRGGAMAKSSQLWRLV
jgi:hypothetical protein